MLLSVCIIVKNEELNIANCIESVKPIADEIIINDTGSSDNTLKIIRAYNIKPIETKWEDDFSKARNDAIKQASGKWILWIDADDIIPKESHKLINVLKERPLDSFFYFKIINTKRGIPIGHNFLQARMFPNQKNVYFEERVHERISQSAIKAGLIACKVTNIKIYHTGYENDFFSKQKANRNIKLIKSINNYKDDPYWLKSLGIEYNTLKEYEKSFDYYLKCSNLEPNAEIFCKLGNSYLNRREFDKAIKYYKIGINYDKDYIELNYQLARSYEFKQDWKNAIKFYNKTISTKDNTSIEVAPYDLAKIYSFHFLLRIYTGFNMNSEAIKLIEQVNIQYPKYKLEYEN